MKLYTKKNKEGNFYYSNPERTILHRETGPAVEHTNGYKEYWLNGKHLGGF